MPRRQLAVQAAAAVAGMAVWLAIIPRIPGLNDLPGLGVMAAFAVVALVFDYRAAFAGVVVGAVGLEIIHAPIPFTNHLFRLVIFMVIGSGAVALSYARHQRSQGAELYRVLFELHPLPIWVFDEQSLELLAVNDAAVHDYGYTRQEWSRMTLHELRGSDDMPAAMNGMWRPRTKDGRVLEVFVRSQAVTIESRRARMAIVEDVTERRSVEEQLRQAQKMEAIGQLAGGVAHDFNNLLTAIRGYAALLVESLPGGDPRRQDAIEIDTAGERAATLTQQLLAFSRKQLLQVRVASLTTIVEDVTPMVRRLVGGSIEIGTRYAAASRVRVDPTQLQQVLVNLVVNARDALPDGGRILIETQDVDVDDVYASEHPMVKPGRHAVLIVSDNGIGMDLATQQRIFEPFFTTKPPGRGTGLGLSTAYGIVKQTGGHIWVYSEPGQGSTFKVYLPVSAEEEDARAVPAAGDGRQAGSGTVLVVEDEDGVRSLLVRLLEQDGFQVLMASRPSAARILWERPDVSLDLLVTDMVLPEMSGRHVASAVRKRHPGCRILFMSGYTREGIVTSGALGHEASFLQKPFTAAELRRSVAETLAGRRG